MEFNFLQILTLFLIFMLFGKEYIPALFKRFFGVEVKSNGYADKIKELEGHAEIANHEMGEVVKSLERIEHRLEKLDAINEGITYLKAKLNGK